MQSLQYLKYQNSTFVEIEILPINRGPCFIFKPRGLFEKNSYVIYIFLCIILTFK